MKTFTALTVALSALATVSAAQAQERQAGVEREPVAIEQLASLLRGTAPPVAGSAGVPVARKVRVVLQSPYGN